MNYGLTEDQKMLQTMAADFAKKEVAVVSKEIEETAEFPFELVRKMGENGFLGLIFPPEYGGSGAGYLSNMLALEQLVQPSTTAGLLLWSIPFDGEGLYRFASEELKQKYLVPLAQGKRLTVIGFSEPETGVYPRGISTKAELVGDEWVINGTKRFQTLSPICDFEFLWARTSPKGLSCFIVEREGTEGWSNPRVEELMGRRGVISSDLILDNVRVPKENLVGEVDMGYPYLLEMVARVESPGIAAESVGIAQAALNEALNFTQTRVQPWTGKPVTVFEGVQYRLADIATDIEAARALAYSLGRMIDSGADYPALRIEAAKAKLFCSCAANRVVNSAIVLHAGYGYTKDFAIERIYRDQKLAQLYGGTEDIQRLIIGQAVAGL